MPVTSLLWDCECTEGTPATGAYRDLMLLDRLLVVSSAMFLCEPLTLALLGCFRLAAEEGAKEAKGPGSLRVELLDNLYGISESAVVEGIRIEKAVAM